MRNKFPNKKKYKTINTVQNHKGSQRTRNNQYSTFKCIKNNPKNKNFNQKEKKDNEISKERKEKIYHSASPVDF